MCCSVRFNRLAARAGLLLHRPRRVVAGDAAHRAAAPRAGPAHEHAVARGLHAPAARPPRRLRRTATSRSRWKMWPPGMPSSASSSSGVWASRHGRPVGRVQQAVLDRLGQHGVDRRQRGRHRRRARGVVVGAKQPRGHVQPEHGQRVHARGLELGTEDRRVGERVAVGLAGRQLGDLPGGRLGMRALELVIALVDVKGAGEGLLRRHGRVAQPGQAAQQQVELELGSLGRVGAAAGRPSARPAPPARRWPAAAGPHTPHRFPPCTATPKSV